MQQLIDRARQASLAVGNTRSVRDSLPEALDYGKGAYYDDGCPELGIPSCFTCPLSACRYERPPGWAHREVKIAKALPVVAAGGDSNAVAAASGCSRRTAFHLIDACKERLEAAMEGAADA